MKTRFPLLLFIVILFCTSNSYGQTVFATETFQTTAAPKGTLANTYVGDMGTWTVANTGVNGASSNNWYVSGEECGNAVGVCGSACPGGDNSLHISAIGGLCATPDCGAAYDETGAANQTNQRAISPTVDCTGNFFIELNFNYIAAQADDGFFVEYSTDNGTIWNTFTGGVVAGAACCACNDALFCAFFGSCCNLPVCAGFEQGLWTAMNLAFPAAADNNPNVKFAFHWSNDGNGVGTDPSVAIDDITLTYATMLSVELTNFQVEAEDNLNQLDWTTISELDADYFGVEHSTDGMSFTEIGQTTSAHNSTGKNHYSFMHEARSRQNYYRLRSVDINGNHAYSEIVHVENDLSSIHLSRLNNQYLVKGLADTKGEITIYDLSGKQIGNMVSFDFETTEADLDLSGLISGIYIINVSSSKGEKRFKIFR